MQNKDITAIIKQIADAYHVTPVEGVLSHVMRRYLIDGEKVIMNKTTPEQQAEEFEVEESDVYAIDIVMSTGEGKVFSLVTVLRVLGL
jgi:methionine aminopeptidase